MGMQMTGQRLAVLGVCAVFLFAACPAEAVLFVHYDFDMLVSPTTVKNLGSGGSAHDGVIAGDTSFTNAPAGPLGGGFGDYANFPGTNDGILMGDLNALDGEDKFTIAMWFRRDTNNTGGGNDTNHGVNNVLFANSANSGNDNIEIGTESNNIEVYLDTGGGGNDATRRFNTTPLGGITDGTWYHLAVTWDAAASPEVRVYLSGRLVGTNNAWNGADVDGSTDHPATLGYARQDNQKWGDFDGAIDEFRLYDDEALTLVEIQALIPEPLTMLAVGMSIAGLGGYVRRRTRS